jgi:hypothetical protein
MPPSQGPSALAVLKAEWLSAAGSAWALPETSMSRVCSTIASAAPMPIRKTSSEIVTILPAAAA